MGGMGSGRSGGGPVVESAFTVPVYAIIRDGHLRANRARVLGLPGRTAIPAR